ncbi:hypothetical protein [Sphaerisporangium sp. TRM90804]|uniref:hypothetical protein n=1 Tax=Sphaerisporangium sp. TRM90804 TaxID=3031113 RepID=UPI0024475E7A|nr:hypothetical protein [Sphaerisporangium sp. TRM90804]MDH2424766.1 hypothetical protein [Sphaerisporangium sp. TRM90804]
MANPIHATLQADVVATITLDRDARKVNVCNVTGTAAVWFTLDGSTPEVEGNGSWVLPAVVSAIDLEPSTAGPTVVKLISEGTPTVSVGAI